MGTSHKERESHDVVIKEYVWTRLKRSGYYIYHTL
jgi:hypothetical protein